MWQSLICRRLFWILGLGVLLPVSQCLAEVPNLNEKKSVKPAKPAKSIVTVASILESAQSAYTRGDRSEALSLINKAIRLEPDNSRGYFARGRWHSSQGDAEKAVADFDKVLELDPSLGDVYQLRGVEQFRLTHVADSILDFNRYLTLAPGQIPYHWQRGISYYYTDRFSEGKQQFELHQSVNPNDVENAAWHFFCKARLESVEKARADLIPISGDPRVPMAQIHSLLAGQATSDQVIAAATAGNPSPATRQRQLFYAHLYLGLYYEVLGDSTRSSDHIKQSVDLAAKDDYMSTVARVHAKLRSLSAKSGKRKL